jgi:tetratricopeptide (TPR) repeat protein
MISRDNGFDLDIRWRFPGGREYAFAFIALFAFLIVIYANSFQGAWQFDDKINIVENRNIALKTLDWPHIQKTFYGIEGRKIDRPLAFLTFALNYYFDGLDTTGYHIVNFIIHYLASIFLFLFIYNTLKLPTMRERYGPTSYSIAMLATVFWATSPVQVTAVTYLVQRMASMAGLFYIMAMYFYLKGRTSGRTKGYVLYGALCVLSAALSFSSKENAVLLPISIWLYDLLLIQGATRENLQKNVKLLAPLILVAAVLGFWYVDISSILSGTAYANRPFTLAERLLTQPRVIIFYITLLFYPISSRLTLIHDIELSKSLLTPWSTMPAIAVIAVLLLLAGYIARKRPLLSFCIFFYFLNHVIESSFIPLEMIYEHRNYIPSMFFFVPVAIVMLHVIDFFSYKKTIQFIMVGVFTFLLAAQGHTVVTRNALFAHPLLLWTDNAEKAPKLSRPYINLGGAYWDRGFYKEAHELYSRAVSLDRQTNLSNRGVGLNNVGMYHLYVTGEYDKAMELFESAIKTYPGLWPAYQNIAECFIRKGDFANAGRRTVAALAKWPDNADLRYTLSFVLLKVGEYDQAIKQARRALSLNPDLSETLSVLGEAYRRKGDYRLATIYWEQYIEKNPNVLEANIALVELYAQQNRKNDLSRTTGKLAVLKGTRSWHEVFHQLLKGTKPAVCSPDPEKTISIIRENLNH